jgi:multidrug resistance efflux pump
LRQSRRCGLELRGTRKQIERLRSSNLSARQNVEHAQAEIERLRAELHRGSWIATLAAESQATLLTKLENLRAAAELAEQTLRSHPSGFDVADRVADAIEASK